MNNKGQTLAVFILFLPIFFLLLALIYDLGSLELTKQKIQSEVKSTIKYGLENPKNPYLKENMETMLNKNLEASFTIEIKAGKIIINVRQIKDSIFPNIIKENYTIDITYKGYIENNKIKITKE